MELYKSPNVPAKVRAKDLLSKMTLEEKIAQLGSVWSYELLTEDGKFSAEKAKEVLKHGIGQITRPGGATNFEPPEVANLVNEIQKFLVENTRLGIPAIMHEECLAGYMGLGAASFPQPIGMASTWDPDLVQKITNSIREDMRKLGITQGLSPVLDVARDPRWGRTEETFGESPYLVARMGVAYVKGLQGDDIRKGVVATAKHFAGYSASEGGKNWAPTNIPPRELREVFLYPFEAAVKEANALSIMNSYSEIDGIPCASSRELLTDILRKQWGFEGIVVSDYFAVDMIRGYHRMAKDKAEAARYALEAGIDVELPKTDCYLHLKSLVEKGLLNEKLIDEAVMRVLTLKFMLGLFEDPYAEAVDKLSEHREIALEAARKSVVLLKNNGVLPLKTDAKIALVGPTADEVRNLLGDYSYLVHIKTLLSNVNETTFNAPKFNLKKVEELVEAHMKRIPSILTEFTKKAKEIYYAKGCDVTDPSKEGFAQAMEAAKKADVVVAVVGDRSGLTVECTSGESRDMANLKLPGVQEEFILELTKVGKPVIVVLVTGRPYSLKAFADKVDAILELWLPGETGAQALAEVVFGEVNPSGRLPISFPASAGQIPVFHYVKPSGGRSCWHGNYVDESVKPLYPFGYGLSYTTFSYSNLRLDKEVAIAGTVSIKVDVENTGSVYGEEVVQVYVSRENASVTRPVKELKGFQRVGLKPGEKKTVVFEMHTDVLAYYNRDMKLAVEPGEYKVMIGSSSEDIRCEDSFVVVGETRVVHNNRVFFTNSRVL